MLTLDGLVPWWASVSVGAPFVSEIAPVPLRKISPLVRDLCKKHDLPYRSFSFYDANVRTIKTLREAAVHARGLTWEAVTIHG